MIYGFLGEIISLIFKKVLDMTPHKNAYLSAVAESIVIAISTDLYDRKATL